MMQYSSVLIEWCVCAILFYFLEKTKGAYLKAENKKHKAPVVGTRNENECLDLT